MKLIIEVDDCGDAREVGDALTHEAESLLIAHPGTADMLQDVAAQIEKQIDEAE